MVNEIYEPFLRAYSYARDKLKLQHPKYGYYSGSITDFFDANHSKFLQDRIQYSRKSGRIVGFIAGPPCPDFSVGGKNQGHVGEKGRLTSSYMDLICQQQPDFFVFENVKGLWRTRKHRIFYEAIKQQVASHGYITTERLINSIEFGVPQDRDRIILIGFRRDLIDDLNQNTNLDSKELIKGAFPWERYTTYVKEQVSEMAWPSLSPFILDSKLEAPHSIPIELTVEHWFRKNNVEEHPNANHHFMPRAAMQKFMTINEGDISKKSFKRLHRWRYSPTAAYGNNEVHIHPYKARRISAAEALAIQSLPKEFVLPPDISLTAMFKTIGNGVPYLAAKALAESIQDFIGNHHETTDRDRISSYDQRFVTQPFLPLCESIYKNMYRPG